MSTAPGVCAVGWVKCREHISLLVMVLYNYVCVQIIINKYNHFTKPISDYGKILKYQETYRYNDISVDLYFFCKCQKFGPHKNNNNINNNNNNFQIHKT